jgi:hypothetical protein
MASVAEGGGTPNNPFTSDYERELAGIRERSIAAQVDVHLLTLPFTDTCSPMLLVVDSIDPL